MKDFNIYSTEMVEQSKNIISKDSKIYTLEKTIEWYNSLDKDEYGNVFDIEEFTTSANFSNSYNNWKSKENITFDFDIQNTLYGGKRLCIKEKGDGGYFINWCFGKNLIELKRCLDWIKTLDEWTIVNFRLCSKIKPLQYDPDFCKYLKNKGFIVNPNSIKDLLKL